MSKKKLLLKKLFFLFLEEDDSFHFFYEPNLIVRVSEDKILKQITKYLDKRKVKYKIYDYPYPEDKKEYGEGKNWDHIFPHLLRLYHLYALMLLQFEGQDIEWFTGRAMHCILNMRGYDWLDEASYHSQVANRRITLYQEKNKE